METLAGLVVLVAIGVAVCLLTIHGAPEGQ